MQGLDVQLSLYEDGEAVQKDASDGLDRWELHASETVRVNVGGESIQLIQAPSALKPTSIGVGAVLWEGELLMAQYLNTLRPHKWNGARVVELGAGPGLLGIWIWKLGSKVVITDKKSVLPLIEKNIDVNCAEDRQHEREKIKVTELEWGKPGYEETAASLAQEGPIDWVLGADCLYIDNEGETPSIPHFVHTCSLLCGGKNSKTKCLVSFELRSEEVRARFLAASAEHQFKVRLIPKPALPKGCQVGYIELYMLSR